MRESEGASRPRVLVVDDEENLRTSLGQILAFEFEVTVCADGREALARIEAGARFDVLLVDLMMPTLSGMDLYARLTAVAPELASRVVFLTGGAFTARAREFLRETPNPRLEKPFDVEQLCATVVAVAAR